MQTRWPHPPPINTTYSTVQHVEWVGFRTSHIPSYNNSISKRITSKIGGKCRWVGFIILRMVFILYLYASFKNVLIYERIHGSLVITAGIYHWDGLSIILHKYNWFGKIKIKKMARKKIYISWIAFAIMNTLEYVLYA